MVPWASSSPSESRLSDDSDAQPPSSGAPVCRKPTRMRAGAGHDGLPDAPGSGCPNGTVHRDSGACPVRKATATRAAGFGDAELVDEGADAAFGVVADGLHCGEVEAGGVGEAGGVARGDRGDRSDVRGQLPRTTHPLALVCGPGRSGWRGARTAACWPRVDAFRHDRLVAWFGSGIACPCRSSTWRPLSPVWSSMR